jgi:hypothetical protein
MFFSSCSLNHFFTLSTKSGYFAEVDVFLFFGFAIKSAIIFIFSLVALLVLLS